MSINQLNVLISWSFRLLCVLFFGVAVLFVLMGAAYLVEPRTDIGYQKLDVVETFWQRSGGKSGASNSSFRAKIILPNGNPYIFTTHQNRIGTNRSVCASIEIGNWLGSYHVEIVPLPSCS